MYRQSECFNNMIEQHFTSSPVIAVFQNDYYNLMYNFLPVILL